MSATKHTKGPWAVNDDGWKVESEKEHGWVNDGWVVAVTHGPDSAANARLIAAAPELLDSLVGYMSAVETMNAAMKDGLNVHGAVAALVGWEDMAKAAIAKATPSLHEGERG